MCTSNRKPKTCLESGVLVIDTDLRKPWPSFWGAETPVTPYKYDFYNIRSYSTRAYCHWLRPECRLQQLDEFVMRHAIGDRVISIMQQPQKQPWRGRCPLGNLMTTVIRERRRDRKLARSGLSEALYGDGDVVEERVVESHRHLHTSQIGRLRFDAHAKKANKQLTMLLPGLS